MVLFNIYGYFYIGINIRGVEQITQINEQVLMNVACFRCSNCQVKQTALHIHS